MTPDRHRQRWHADRARIARGRASSSTSDGWRRAIEALVDGALRRCSGCGATPAPCIWRCSRSRRRNRRRSGSPARSGRFPSVGALHPPGDPARARDPRPLRARADGAARHAALARSRPLGRHAAARRRPSAGRPRAPIASCPSRARACIRSRSGRCMPASSSPAISASPPMARPWCGSRSGSAMCTRASRR